MFGSNEKIAWLIVLVGIAASGCAATDLGDPDPFDDGSTSDIVDWGTEEVHLSSTQPYKGVEIPCDEIVRCDFIFRFQPVSEADHSDFFEAVLGGLAADGIVAPDEVARFVIADVYIQQPGGEGYGIISGDGYAGQTQMVLKVWGPNAWDEPTEDQKEEISTWSSLSPDLGGLVASAQFGYGSGLFGDEAAFRAVVDADWDERVGVVRHPDMDVLDPYLGGGVVIETSYTWF